MGGTIYNKKTQKPLSLEFLLGNNLWVDVVDYECTLEGSCNCWGTVHGCC